MVSFTIAMETSLGILHGIPLQRYGYLCTVQPIEHRRKTSSPPIEPSRCHRYRVTLEHEATGERSSWMVATDLTDWIEPQGWVLPLTDEGALATLPYTTFRSRPEAQHYEMSAVFPILRQELASIYLQKIAKRSSKRFASWHRYNAQDLSVLKSFYPAIPEQYRAPLVFILQQQWDAVFARLHNSAGKGSFLKELRAINKNCVHYKISIDLSYSAALCEKMLVDELEKLKVNLSPVHCDRIRSLLNIVDYFSLPVSKHRLEDIFYPILTGPLHQLYLKAKKTTNEEKMIIPTATKELLIKLLNFAHRMNFNTDVYEQV
jgi:hypothetical protein